MMIGTEINTVGTIGKGKTPIADSLSSHRKFGSKLITVTQDANTYLKHKGKNAAFKDWIYKLNRGDTLPRGKFFQGKSAGKPLLIMDESHLLFN